MSAELTKQQLEAREKFKKLKVGALFMQMGTGKTRVALELINYNQPDFLLYLTPCSTKDNVTAEIEKWGVCCEYKVVGYESIASSDRIYLETLELLEQKEKCFIVADESIFIKNGFSKRFKRACALREKCEYALVLNGTPITKSEWDLYNQMYFLSPMIIGMSADKFRNTFFKKVKYKRRYQKEKTFYKFSEVNAAVLTKLVQPYVFNADLVFDKKESSGTIWVNYTEEEYESVKEDELNKMACFMTDDICALLVKLNNIACCSKEKNEVVAEYIRGKQVIVYCNYLEEVNQIRELVDCYVITGSTKERAEIIEDFKNDCKPLLMTYGVGSYSLNLQFCKEIVYSGINFDYGRMEQSRFRIKRTGQEQDIEYTYILADLGINKMILKNLDKKSTLKEIVEQKIQKGDVKKWLKTM